jgi:hypothetical protein
MGGEPARLEPLNRCYTPRAEGESTMWSRRSQRISSKRAGVFRAGVFVRYYISLVVTDRNVYKGLS